MCNWRRLWILSGLLLVGWVIPAAGWAQDKKPNILFIIADDQSPFDLKIYNPKIPTQTPVLDKLAAGGVVFDGAYHMGSFSGAVCRPSRYMVMTGRTLWNVRNMKPVDGVDPVETSMAAVFNRDGNTSVPRVDSAHIE